MAIRDLIVNKTGKERATIKGSEIAKLLKTLPRQNVKFSGADFDIEIIATSAIEDGIQVFARAWDASGNPVGLGADGTVEIERFRIYNPPINVYDPLGDIEIIRPQHIDTLTGDVVIEKIERYRESPVEALLQELVHTIHVVAKDGKNIISGKRGNTTSTFRSVDDSVDPCDGLMYHTTTNATFATVRAGAGTSILMTAVLQAGIWAGTSSDRYDQFARGLSIFDTSAISSGDSITSAVYSAKTKPPIIEIGNPDLHIYWGASASNNVLVSGDYASNVASASIGNSPYATLSANGNNTASSATFCDITLSDVTNVNKGTGARTKIASGTQWDVNNSAPTWGSGNRGVIEIHSADTSGTADDPKLVVVHSAASGPANLKSLDTNLKANIKSWNTNLIANIKSINTNV